jgi:hypothetical protein
MDDDEIRFLEIAYEEADGSPMSTVSSQAVGRKLGTDEDRQRRLERDLMDRGLLEDAGSGYRLRIPAIHGVEEQRLEEGREEVVDERRQQRGDYVREVYDLADEDPTLAVPLSDVKEQLAMAADVEKRTREHLEAAGLVVVDEEDHVQLTKQGAEWARQA